MSLTSGVIVTGMDSELNSILADTGVAEDHFPDPAETNRETAALMGHCEAVFCHPGGLNQRVLRRRAAQAIGKSVCPPVLNQKKKEEQLKCDHFHTFFRIHVTHSGMELDSGLCPALIMQV